MYSLYDSHKTSSRKLRDDVLWESYKLYIAEVFSSHMITSIIHYLYCFLAEFSQNEVHQYIAIQNTSNLIRTRQLLMY